MGILDQTISATVANAFYVKHPTGGYAQDGNSVSAANAMILDNNVCRLAHESVRHIATIQGPGALGKSGDPHGYSGLRDVRQPLTFPDQVKISWDRTTSAHVGPLYCIADQDGHLGATLLRPVRIAVYCKSGSSNSLQLAAALTKPGITPWDGDNFHFVSWVNVPTSDGFVTLDLAPTTPITADTVTQQVRSRSLSGNGAYANIIEYYAWLGWYSTDSADRVYTASFWESREISY